MSFWWHRWYSQAGVPRLTVSTSYDANAKTFALRVQQHTPPTPGQAKKEPVLIPLTVGLLGLDGEEMPLKLQVHAILTLLPLSVLGKRQHLRTVYTIAFNFRSSQTLTNSLMPQLVQACQPALQGSSASLGTSTVLRVEKAEEQFVFEDVHARPVASLLRNFSAPVKMTVLGQTDEDLAHMLAYDTDPFNR